MLPTYFLIETQFRNTFPSLSASPYRLQLLDLLLQDRAVTEKVTVVLLVLAKTLTGIAQLNWKGILLFE